MWVAGAPHLWLVPEALILPLSLKFFLFFQIWLFFQISLSLIRVIFWSPDQLISSRPLSVFTHLSRCSEKVHTIIKYWQDPSHHTPLTKKLILLQWRAARRYPAIQRFQEVSHRVCDFWYVAIGPCLMRVQDHILSSKGSKCKDRLEKYTWENEIYSRWRPTT